MEKRKSARRRTVKLKSTARGVVSDAESTVSTRSSNSSNSSTSWKQKQRRLKTGHLGRDHAVIKGEQAIGEDVDAQMKSLEKTLGATLETTEAQLAMIFLIALDVGCTALEIHLQDQLKLATALQQLASKVDDGSSVVATSLLVRIATRLVESFTGFTLFLFLIELVVLLVAFRRKFFAHAGYVLDLVVVTTSLAVELYTQTKALRLLGVLRVWRMLRLVRRLVDQERDAHDATHLLLEQEQLKLLHVRMQKDAAHESLKREYESREGLEQLLRSYKDEIVTLKEALQIAAQAVAEARMAESPSVAMEQYDVSESAGNDDSYPGEYGYGEEYYQQKPAAVHPTEMQAEEVESSYWQENEASEYHYSGAAAVHPTVQQELEQDETEQEEPLQDAAAVNPTEVQVKLEAEHSHESDGDKFEDAVGE